MTGLNGSTPVYAVRISELFSDQSDAAVEWLLANANPATAKDWLNGLQDAKASLATLPHRSAVATENKAFQKSALARRYAYSCTGTVAAHGAFCSRSMRLKGATKPMSNCISFGAVHKGR